MKRGKAEIVELGPVGTPSRGGNDNGGSSYGERLARIEAKMEHVATREDVAKMEHVATREDVAKIETLIERKESAMLKWLIGIVITAGISFVTAGIGLIVALFRNIG